MIENITMSVLDSNAEIKKWIDSLKREECEWSDVPFYKVFSGYGKIDICSCPRTYKVTDTIFILDDDCFTDDYRIVLVDCSAEIIKYFTYDGSRGTVDCCRNYSFVLDRDLYCAERKSPQDFYSCLYEVYFNGTEISYVKWGPSCYDSHYDSHYKHIEEKEFCDALKIFSLNISINDLFGAKIPLLPPVTNDLELNKELQNIFTVFL